MFLLWSNPKPQLWTNTTRPKSTMEPASHRLRPLVHLVNLLIYPLVERMQKNGQTVCWWEASIGLRLSLHMLRSTPTIKPHHFLHYWKRNFFPRTMWPSFFSSSRCGPPPLDFFKHPPEDDFKNPLDQAQAVGGSHLSHLWTFHGSSPSTSQSAMLFVWLSSQPPSPALGCRAAHSSEGEQKNFLWVWVGGATVFVCLIFTE